MAQYEKAPTSILATTPLKSAPPRGKTFVYAQCAFPQCKDEAVALQQATAALGWNYKVIPFDSANPASLIAAMNQALLYKPVATAIGGLPETLWSGEVPAYKKAGAIIVPIDIGSAPTSPTVPMDVAGGVAALSGKLAGDEFLKAGGTKAVLVNVPSFPILSQIGTAMRTAISSGCPSCSITPLNATIAQQASNGIVPAVVSTLQRLPNVKYLLAADGELLPGLPAALAAAGLSGITVISAGGGSENLQDIKAGTELATTQENLAYNGLLALDAAVRHVEGMSIMPTGGGTPVEVLTKSNLPATLGDGLTTPANALQQFERLWKVG